MKIERIINAIIYHVGCNEEEANMIYNGVYSFNGDNYSAYLTEDEKLEICKNGFPIHRLIMM